MVSHPSSRSGMKLFLILSSVVALFTVPSTAHGQTDLEDTLLKNLSEAGVKAKIYRTFDANETISGSKEGKKEKKGKKAKDGKGKGDKGKKKSKGKGGPLRGKGKGNQGSDGGKGDILDVKSDELTTCDCSQYDDKICQNCFDGITTCDKTCVKECCDFGTGIVSYVPVFFCPYAPSLISNVVLRVAYFQPSVSCFLPPCYFYIVYARPEARREASC